MQCRRSSGSRRLYCDAIAHKSAVNPTALLSACVCLCVTLVDFVTTVKRIELLVGTSNHRHQSEWVSVYVWFNVPLDTL